ncbi:MAG: hypothetical protein CSA24_00715 [Deltaproteobacteria bacterium]|nr:MAG: hypothetical protein CSB49_07825 [Pseudomonadota bacterium]PIE66266.1 MAG: hypothetical protein CSA24_00715 [Deltaproteobacteria bacterium]
MKSVSCKLLLVTLSVGLLTGCEVTAEKIKTWKGTQKGPAKLRAAVLDDKVKTDLRVMAAEALAEINLVDYLAKDLKTLAAGARDKVTGALSARLIKRMEGTSPQATTKVQIQAKDALFSLRGAFSDATRRKADEALVKWVAGDWIARSGGEHSAEKVVTTIGASAAPMLAESIGADPKVVLTIAKLLKKIGKEADRLVAAKKLVAHVMDYNPPQKASFEALGRMQAPASRAYLQKVAKVGKGEYRGWALRALKYDPDPSTIPVAGAIAGSAKEPDPLRGAAFEALETIKGAKTAEVLSKIIATDPKDLVRYRAIEAITACCGGEGVGKLLEALPSKENYKKRDVKDFIEKDIKRVGKAAVPALRKALESKSWIARVIAVRLLGQLGSKQDADALSKMTADRAKLKGWGSPATVGSEAKAALASLK